MMKIKKLIPYVLLCVIPLMNQQALADEIISKMNLTKVTLFLQGAELKEESSIELPAGESEILLTNLANDINVNSINVGVNNQAMILSTSLVDNYLLEKVESDTLTALKNSFNILKEQQDILTIKLSAVEEEIALLQGNRINAFTKQNATLIETKQAINFIKDNLINALQEQRSIEIELAETQKRMTQYQSEIAKEEGDYQTSSKVVKLKIYSKEAQTLPIQLSYITKNAGWEPAYDVRVTDINSPLVLTYKANIYQHSGLSWNDIDFTLSTANPIEGITAPQPQPWNIYLYEESSFNIKSTKMNMYKGAPTASYSDNNFNNHITTSHNGLNTQFSINLPYSIASYSDNNILILKAKEVVATYQYIATPKLDHSAFLQAQINDWDKLSLLPGRSSVFYGGNYVGETYITTKGLKDNLNISLGRDEGIIISRNQNINETSKPSFFGNEISQKFAYTINVKNSKIFPVDITVYDQLPVIRNKTIELEDPQYKNATYDKETGLLSWKFQLNQNEARQIPFSFKIAYPKDKANDIIGL